MYLLGIKNQTQMFWFLFWLQTFLMLPVKAIWQKQHRKEDAVPLRLVRCFTVLLNNFDSSSENIKNTFKCISIKN